jgi:hypothetical protein
MFFTALPSTIRKVPGSGPALWYRHLIREMPRIGSDLLGVHRCGQGKEDTLHFLFHCHRYQHLRGEMVREGKERYGDLSYMLGGRSSQKKPDGSNLDGPREKWKPNVAAVRATIKFARKTGRLSPQPLSSSPIT